MKTKKSVAAKRVARLAEQNKALRKTVRALAERVEHVIDSEGSSFSWFQAAAKLEETVRLRTEQYESLNARLTKELESRREIETALKQAKHMAEVANQAKTRFLAAASHDLRQPLNSAVLFLESTDESQMPRADRELIQRAKVSLASLNNLLGTLLDSARLDSGSISPRIADFPLSALFERMAPEFQSVAKAAGLELEVMPTRAWVRTDMHLLETVLRNFMSNAIRYTQQGRVVVGCRRGAHALAICVYDTGIGIEAKHLQAIFEEYYQVPMTARPRDAGIGLGLSIVSRIARLLSLECTVRSTLGSGSCFAVKVPYGEARDAAATLDAWQIDGLRQHSGRSLNVIVIDDNSEVLRSVGAILAKWGHRPVTATTATDAVVQLITADVQPDLIISDYHLADGVKGDEAIVEVQRELDAEVPALVMTSDADLALRDRLQRRGLTVLAKPLNLGKLRAMLDRLPADH
jgi:two-component system, sensor histidine kinase